MADTPISPVPINTPLVGQNGLVNYVWAKFFQSLQAGAGGGNDVTFPITIEEGGTGETTGQAAIDALIGTQTSGQYMRSDGTLTKLSAIQAADVPTLNQNTTGNAATATLAAEATAPAAGSAHGAVTLNGSADFQTVPPGTVGNFLRDNGTDFVSSAIQVADVPILNQNTTGIAATAIQAISPATGADHSAVTLSGTGAFQGVAPGVVGTFMRSNGTDFVGSAILTPDLPSSFGKNYISNYNFETNVTTGWTLGNTSLTSGFPSGSPSFGSGYSSHLEMATQASTILGGSYSLKVDTAAASGGAWVAGDFLATQACTIDAEDQAKVLAFKFYYEVGGGTVSLGGNSSNTWAVLIYDVTNSAWIQPAGTYSMIQSSGVGIAQGTFQAPSNMTQFRLVLCCINASTGTTTLYLDDFYTGPQALAFGPAMTDFSAYTPVVSGLGSGTLSTNFAQWRRVGDSVDIAFRFVVSATAGTGSSVVTVSLPSGLTADSSKINASPEALGTATSAFGTGQNIDVTISAGSTTFNFSNKSTGAGIVGSAWTASSVVTGFIKIPISGWSSNTSLSSDTDTRVVAMQATGASATITGSASSVTWTTVVSDTHGAMGTTTYTVPVTGYYDFSGSLYVGATSLSAGGGFIVSLLNSTASSTLRQKQYLFDLNVPENESIDFNFQKIYLKSGTAIIIQVATAGTVGTPVVNSSATLNYFSVGRSCGPAVVAATETVGANYTSTASSGWPTTETAFVPPNKTYDTHNAYNNAVGGAFVVPVSGEYRVHAVCSATGSGTETNNVILRAYGGASGSTVFGEDIQTIAFATGIWATAKVDVTIKCNAGDQLKVTNQYGGSSHIPNYGGAAQVTYVEFFRVGN